MREMADQASIVLVILAIAGPLLSLGDTDPRCQGEQQIQRFVGQCMSDAGVRYPSKVQALGLEKACNENYFDAGLTCVEAIIDTCLSKGAQQDLLDKFVSVEKMRTAFTYICEHKDVLQKHTECMGKLDMSGVDLCARNVLVKSRNETEDKIKSGELDTNNFDQMLPYLCPKMVEDIKCIQVPFATCGDDLAEVIGTNARAFLYPPCDEYYSGMSGSSVFAVNMSTIFLIVVAAMYFRNS